MSAASGPAQQRAVNLLLLPGLDGTDIFLRPLIAALPAWVKPVVATFPQGGPHGYAELLGIARSAVAGIESFYVLGWSFAGPLALRLACAEPHRTRGVILSATFVRAPRRWLPPLIRVMTPLTLFLFRFVRRLPIWLLRSSSDPFRRAKAEAWERVPASALAGRSRAIAKVDARADLCACGAPVIYLASSRDSVVPRHNADEIARERPDVRCVTIDGGHLAMFTNPGAAARAIVEFLLEREEQEERLERTGTAERNVACGETGSIPGA